MLLKFKYILQFNNQRRVVRGAGLCELDQHSCQNGGNIAEENLRAFESLGLLVESADAIKGSDSEGLLGEFQKETPGMGKSSFCLPYNCHRSFRHSPQSLRFICTSKLCNNAVRNASENYAYQRHGLWQIGLAIGLKELLRSNSRLSNQLILNFNIDTLPLAKSYINQF